MAAATRVAVAAIVLAAFGGCSDGPGGDPDARDDVVHAIRAMADPEPATIRFELPYATADDLFGLSVGIEREVAELVEGAAITIQNDFGPHPLEQVFSLTVDLEAGSIEARQLRDELYLRGDLADIVRGAGIDPRALMRALSRERLLRPLLRPAFRGGWIHVFGGGELLGTAIQDGGAGRTEEVTDAFADAVEDAAAVTPSGEDDAGSKYHVELRLDLFVEALSDAAEGLVPSPPSQEEIDAVPDEELTFDVWLDDGKLSRVEADISQLIDLARTGATGKRPPLILRVDVDPFDAKLPRPRPKAGIPAAAFFRLLEEAGAG